jgi:hypothetical protein
MLHGSGFSDEAIRRGDVRDDLVGIGTYADVTDVGDLPRGAVARGETDNLPCHEGHVAAGLGR